MINLNKSQLQEIHLSSSMGLLLHWLQGDHLTPFLFLLCFQGCFSHFFFPLLLTVAFCRLSDAFFPRGTAEGLCRAQPWGCPTAVTPCGSSTAQPRHLPLPRSHGHGGVSAVQTRCSPTEPGLKMSSAELLLQAVFQVSRPWGPGVAVVWSPRAGSPGAAAWLHMREELADLS